MTRSSEVPPAMIAQFWSSLSRLGWNSAGMAMSRIQLLGDVSIDSYQVNASTLAGIYGLRNDLLSTEPWRTVDLQRFAEALTQEGRELVRFFSVTLGDWRFLCVVSDDLIRPVGLTAVRGGRNSSTITSGAVGRVPVTRALELCANLAGEDWKSAGISFHHLQRCSEPEVPVWLATPSTLSVNLKRASMDSRNQGGSHCDVERFVRVMESTKEEAVKVFHTFGSDGWQVSCALSADLSRALASMGLHRRT